MRVDNSTGKGTSSMDKVSSKVHGEHMELGGKLLYMHGTTISVCD